MLNYNTLLEKLLLPVGDQLIGSKYISTLNECRKFDQFSKKELRELQLSKLEVLLKFALINSDYYKQCGVKINCDPVSMLKQFPILNKSILRSNPEEIATKSLAKLNKQSSSGSSGIQSTIYLSNLEQSIPRAQQTRWWEWAGYTIGDSILQTGMFKSRSLIKKTKDTFFKTQYVDAFSLSPEEIIVILENAKQKKIKHFYGYASSLYLFAEVAESYGIDIDFKSMLSWGDKLFDHYKKKIDKVFGVQVKETYGSAEGLMIAGQYDLPYLYIMTPWIYLELLDDEGKEVKDGEMGRVVVTSLSAKSFPLIRYDLGDLAIKLPIEKYPSNKMLPYPLLEKVIGRDTDIVRTSFGQSLIVHTFTGIFEFYPEVRQFQVYQEVLDKIKIRYIPARENITKSLEEIRRKILSKLNNEIDIEFIEVDVIHASKSGKPQIIESTL